MLLRVVCLQARTAHAVRETFEPVWTDYRRWSRAHRNGKDCATSRRQVLRNMRCWMPRSSNGPRWACHPSSRKRVRIMWNRPLATRGRTISFDRRDTPATPVGLTLGAEIRDGSDRLPTIVVCCCHQSSRWRLVAPGPSRAGPKRVNRKSVQGPSNRMLRLHVMQRFDAQPPFEALKHTVYTL